MEFKKRTLIKKRSIPEKLSKMMTGDGGLVKETEVSDRKVSLRGDCKKSRSYGNRGI
jgi:hypothetical protein